MAWIFQTGEFKHFCRKMFHAGYSAGLDARNEEEAFESTFNIVLSNLKDRGIRYFHVFLEEPK